MKPNSCLFLEDLQRHFHFERPRHIRYGESLCYRLEFDPHFNFVLTEWPLGHGKSTLFSFVYPLFCMLTNPNERVLVATGSDTLTKKLYAMLAAGIDELGCLTGVKIDPAHRSIGYTKMAKPHTGEIYFAGGESKIVQGLHPTRIIWDDLCSSYEDAASEAKRRSLSDWFWGVLLNRLEPGGKMLGVMSRRHPADLAGEVQAENDFRPDERKFHVSRLPIFAEKDDPLGRKPGSVLWPERWSMDWALGMRETLDLQAKSHLWASQYLQDPTQDPGLCEFPRDWFRDDKCSPKWDILYDDQTPLPDAHIRIVCGDPSLGHDRKRGDYSALMHLIFAKDGTCYVDESSVKVLNSEAMEDTFVSMLDRLRPHACILESFKDQETYSKNIVKKCSARNVPCPMHELNTWWEDKNVRIRTTHAWRLRQHLIRLRDTPDNRRGLGQLLEFPSAAHDDFPDGLDVGFQLYELLMSAITKRKQPATVFQR